MIMSALLIFVTTSIASMQARANSLPLYATFGRVFAVRSTCGRGAHELGAKPLSASYDHSRREDGSWHSGGLAFNCSSRTAASAPTSVTGSKVPVTPPDRYPLAMIQWGDVPEWVGGLGTTAAFTATFFVIRRDANERQREQARKIVFYQAEMSPGTAPSQLARIAQSSKEIWTYELHNLSDEPIYSVNFQGLHGQLEIVPILLPGEHHHGSPSLDPYVTVTFTDNSGGSWERNMFGKLTYKGRATVLGGGKFIEG
jgi:hypothetical protein